MSFRTIDIDHLMIGVANLDRGVEKFRRLGFRVAPPRRPTSAARGLTAAALAARVAGSEATSPDTTSRPTFAHRHILFQPYPGRKDVANFLELFCNEDQLNTPPALTKMMCFLLDSEGPKSIICSSDDAMRAYEEMVAGGIEASPPIEIESGWYDEERDRFLRVARRPVVVVFGQTPFMVSTCDIQTLESLHYEPWTQHTNSAKYMAGITGITEQLEEHTRLMRERVFGVEPEWESENSAVIRPRDLFLRMITPAGFAKMYPGLDFSRERILPALCGATIAVESLDAARASLEATGVEHRETPLGGIVVPRHEAANTIIEFVPA